MTRHDVQGPRSRIGRRVLGFVVVFAVGIFVLVRTVEGNDPAGASSATASTPTATPSTATATPQSSGIFTASGVELTNGATVPAVGFSPITVRAVSASQTRVKCVADGVYLGTVASAPYRFDIASVPAGDHKLRCTVQGDVDNTNNVRFSIATIAAPTPSSSVGRPVPSAPVMSSAPVPNRIVVADAVGLQKALADARPGTTITLRDGSYSGAEVRDPSGQEPGRFRATISGTAAEPIVLTGSRKAIIDGGGTGGGYALHLKGEAGPFATNQYSPLPCTS